MKTDETQIRMLKQNKLTQNMTGKLKAECNSNTV